MTIRSFFSFQENKFFWVNIIMMIVIVCLLIFGILKGLDIYTQHGKSVEVPDVKGMGVKEAGMLLRNRGLEYLVVDSNYVKNSAPGSILEQNPSSGMKVKDGRTIYLTVNSDIAPLCAVPDVADNSSFRQAQAKLLSLGFKLTGNEYVNGEREWVYGVKYNGRQLMAGEKVPLGATLTLLVGNGTHDEIPDSVITEEVVASEDAVVDDSWF